jgi:hypothetical protein
VAPAQDELAGATFSRGSPANAHRGLRPIYELDGAPLFIITSD